MAHGEIILETRIVRKGMASAHRNNKILLKQQMIDKPWRGPLF
ncbi:MAG: hypothetical protein ACKVP5_12300 [Aestuariivirga sp.]